MPLVSRLKRFYEFSTELGKISLELPCGEWHLDLFKDSLEPVYNPRLCTIIVGLFNIGKIPIIQWPAAFNTD